MGHHSHYWVWQQNGNAVRVFASTPLRAAQTYQRDCKPDPALPLYVSDRADEFHFAVARKA